MKEPAKFEITNKTINVSSDIVEPSDLRVESELPDSTAAHEIKSLLGGVSAAIKHGVNVPEHQSTINPVDRSELIESTIEVTVELLQRLYSGLYILSQVFTQVPAEEKQPLMKTAIDTQLLEPLISVFPDMKNFEYELTVDADGTPTVRGTNSFAKTLLYGIQLSLEAPTGEIETHDVGPQIGF